jgi:hypothetical protein
MPHFKDLAPSILRQRLVIEGYPSYEITDVHIKHYLSELSDVLAMKPLMSPITNRSHEFGWAGWIHWETSGAHFYAWDRPKLFFSVDIYTCKAFEPPAAVSFTKQFFEATALVHESF